MLPKSSRLQAPSIVEDNNETTNRKKIKDLIPTAVDDINNDSVEHANTVLKSNNIFGAHVMEEKKEWFYQCANNYNVWDSYSFPPKKGMDMKYLHQISQIVTSENVNHKYGTFEANY